MKNLVLSITIFLCALSSLQAQDTIKQIVIGGEVYKALITDEDTIIIANLTDVSVTSRRQFKNSKERKHYLRMRYYAAKVYPYAVEAVKTFKQVDYITNDMKRRQKKRYIKKLKKNMKKDFKDPLKKLTKTQGKVLIKMIEREIEKPIFSVIKQFQGGFNAQFWHQMGKMYGYDLKRGYYPEDDPILESVLRDFDVTYEVSEDDIKALEEQRK